MNTASHTHGEYLIHIPIPNNILILILILTSYKLQVTTLQALNRLARQIGKEGNGKLSYGMIGRDRDGDRDSQLAVARCSSFTRDITPP